jgi:hypothetical protein
VSTWQASCSPCVRRDLFLFVGHLPLMARRTVDMYEMLLIHFQRIVFSDRDGWVHSSASLSLGNHVYFAQALSDSERLSQPDCF